MALHRIPGAHSATMEQPMGNKKRSRLPAGIKRLADGRYQIRATYQDPITGKRKDRVSTLPHQTKLVEAVAALESLRATLECPTTAVTVPTLKTCCGSWLTRKAQRGRRPTTIGSYAYCLGRCLDRSDPTLPLDRYTRRHLLHLRTALESDVGKLSAETLRDWWRVWVRMIRDSCVDHGLPDPTYRVEGPAVSSAPRREERTLSREEVVQLVEQVEATTLGSDYGVAVTILAYPGCRLGEMRALTWGAVDLGARIITIRASVSWTTDARWTVTTPKSGRGRRVAMAPALHARLLRHREARKRSGELPVGDTLVCHARSGNYLQATSVRRRLQAATVALGWDIHVSPQVLRRTWNTLALEMIDRVVVQAQVGHTDDSMSAHYLGVRDDTLRASAKAMWEIDVGGGSKSESEAKENKEGTP